MAEESSRSRLDHEGLPGRSLRDKMFRFGWTYLRGALVLVVLVLAAQAIGRAYSRLAEWLELFTDLFESSAPSVVVVLTILILGPWAIGKVVDLFLTGNLFQRQRGVRAYQRMERRLTTELKADRHRGYRVAFVNWPNPNTRTLGLVVADFSEPETACELAAVYLPGTPDPARGSLRIVAAADLVPTDWDLSDLLRFHVTFGSASPDLSDSVEKGGDESAPKSS